MSHDHNLMEIRPEYLAVLVPFMRMMANELERNNHKGLPTHWPNMSQERLLLAVHSQMGSLHHAWSSSNENALAEHTADLANMAMVFASATGQLEHYSLPDDAELANYLAAVTRYGLANRKAIERHDLLKQVVEILKPSAYYELPEKLRDQLIDAVTEAP